MEFKVRNVNDAFKTLVEGIHSGRVPTDVRPSRYGEVIRVEEPVLLTYQRPLERVLFNPARDANPFFHVYEALWMLAGRQDVAPLVYYNKKMAEFSDDGQTFNGAYGYRWRHALPKYLIRFGVGGDEDVGEPVLSGSFDQLDALVRHLRNKPESRRAVLQMWEVGCDLMQVDKSKDVCCNTCVYFSVEPGLCRACNGKTDYGAPGPCPACGGMPHDRPRYLNMTVCNRSNDLVWGMLGANAVHFSFLQEYLAARIGLDVGVYRQFTNDLHVYTERWEPLKWLTDYEQGGTWSHEWYGSENYTHVPLVRNPDVFEKELPIFVERNSHRTDTYSPVHWEEPFLNDVAQPMMTAFRAHKEHWGGGTQTWVNSIKADDWRIASRNWIERRSKGKEAKYGLPAGVD